MIRVTVVMAVYNGEKYLAQQLDSILPQLGRNDEVIVSDDGSTDRTREIVQSYAAADPRICLVAGPGKGVRQNIANALLFAAYLSSAQPEVAEDETQKRIYRPSTKHKYSSLRKWDVGVRYMAEKQVYAKKQGDTANTSPPEPGMQDTADGKQKRHSPRPHMRKAHWQTYRIGYGRKEKKVLWIPPVTVGMSGMADGDQRHGNITAVVRERKENL